MGYTISEAAKRTGLTVHTLRYYDKEGLMPYVSKDKSGKRIFEEKDFRWLNLINCFKKSGMSLKQIKEYIQWSMAGDDTLEVRLEAMKKHKEIVARQMTELEECMNVVDHKIWYYETAVAAGTEKIHQKQTYQYKNIENA